MQDHLKIVNHQIEDHPDIETAIGKGREPVRFNEAGMAEAFLELLEDGIEALDVANLEDPFGLAGDLEEFLRLCFVAGDGLLDQDMDPPAQEIPTYFEVIFGRDRHAHGIAARCQGLQRIDHLAPEFRRHSLCSGPVHIKNSLQSGPLQHSVDSGVISAHRPCPCDPRADFHTDSLQNEALPASPAPPLNLQDTQI